MNIMVFDVPAEVGGALTILKEYYTDAKLSESINWIFVISKPHLEETNNIKVLRFPWIKKSWIHRLYFDNFIAPKLVKKYKADEILSLQNVIVPKVKVPQTLYVHQSLPFIDKRFKITENLLFWVYQNIMDKKIFKSIREANQVIVQTNWMKTACAEKANINPEKIIVSPPKTSIEIKQYFEPKKLTMRTFFYPANALVYKNHKVIVEACILLKERGVTNYKVIFTLNGDENNNISKLHKQARKNHLPIQFIGHTPIEKVYEYYGKSVLIFPSYIETFGLPMLEAKLHRTPIFASDCPFSHEILDGYESVKYFKTDDPMMLSEFMENSC